MLDLEQHENMLNELNSEETSIERRTEILNTFRSNYGEVFAGYNNLTSEHEKLQSKHHEILEVNSQLFRQLGQQQFPDDLKKKQENESFSESITLDALEK